MSSNTETRSNEDVYWGYVNKLAVPLGLERSRTGSATVNVRSEDVEVLETVWESSMEGDVLSVKKTGDSSFKLIWRSTVTFAKWTVALIDGMYHHGYMLQAKDGEMHFEYEQHWKATGLSPRKGYDGLHVYDIIEDNNIPLLTGAPVPGDDEPNPAVAKGHQKSSPPQTQRLTQAQRRRNFANTKLPTASAKRKQSRPNSRKDKTDKAAKAK
jgi:hypothetical protein